MTDLRPLPHDSLTAPAASVDERSQLDALKDQLLVFARELNEVFLRERSHRKQLKQTLGDLQESYLSMVKTLAFVVEAKDAYTRHHLERTYQYALALSRRIDPEIAADEVLGYGFLLHDVGKVGVPESILCKPGPLTEEEWAVMRSHPLLGVQIVSPMRFLGPALDVIRYHHERWDGKGYPEGRRGEEIPLAARIFSVVDTFDAMTSDRPYRRALDFDVAVEEIRTNAGTQFDPDVTERFIDLCEEIWTSPAGGTAS